MNFFASKEQALASGAPFFHSFTLAHLFYLMFCAAMIAVVMRSMKGRSQQTRDKVLRYLCLLLPVSQALRIAWEVYAGIFTWQYSMPFQVCSSMSWIALFYFITKNTKFLDYIYIVGCSVGTAALLFANLNGNYPSFYYYTWQYFFHHTLFVLIGLFHVFVCGRRPQIRTAWFTAAILAVLVSFDMALNQVINTLLHLPRVSPTSANYGWLSFGAPGTPLGTIEKIFGTRFYFVGEFLAAIIVFGLMYVPFIVGDRRRRRQTVGGDPTGAADAIDVIDATDRPEPTPERVLAFAGADGDRGSDR